MKRTRKVRDLHCNMLTACLVMASIVGCGQTTPETTQQPTVAAESDLEVQSTDAVKVDK